MESGADYRSLSPPNPADQPKSDLQNDSSTPVMDVDQYPPPDPQFPDSAPLAQPFNPSPDSLVSSVFHSSSVIAKCPSCQLVGPTQVERVYKSTKDPKTGRNTENSETIGNNCFCLCCDDGEECDFTKCVVLLLVFVVFFGVILLYLGVAWCCKYVCSPKYDHLCPSCSTVIGKSYSS